SVKYSMRILSCERPLGNDGSEDDNMSTRNISVYVTSFGDNGEREPRVSISNTNVKSFSADGTWTAGSWESRTSPSGIEKNTCCKAQEKMVTSYSVATNCDNNCDF